MFSDIKVIRRDQKWHRHVEACRASPTCFWPSLINLISKTLTAGNLRTNKLSMGYLRANLVSALK